jgi:Ca2+-binding RTX toxin-like protein
MSMFEAFNASLNEITGKFLIQLSEYDFDNEIVAAGYAPLFQPYPPVETSVTINATYTTTSSNVSFDFANGFNQIYAFDSGPYVGPVPSNGAPLLRTGCVLSGDLFELASFSSGSQFSFIYANDLLFTSITPPSPLGTTVAHFQITETHDYNVGSVGDDTIDVSGSTTAAIDFIFGNAGDDSLTGSNFHGDFIDGGTGDDLISGKAGNDQIKGGDGADFILGGADNDVIYGDEGNDNLQGGTGIDDLYGGNGNDILNGGIELDRLFGGFGDDSYTFGATTQIYELAGQGTDKVKSTITANLLTNAYLANIENIDLIGIVAINAVGNNGINIINGNFAANYIKSYAGDDVISGGGGNDLIEGGLGKDTMSGGLGRDTFYWRSVSESPSSGLNQDIVTDFIADAASRLALTSDRINVATIDAMAGTAGNNVFTYIGNAAFTAEGQVRSYLSGGNTIVEANTTGLAGAEMTIIFNGAQAFIASDFIL